MRRAVGSLLDLDAVGLCWDIGHDARSGWAESDFMMGNLERIWHMHFHDYDGRSDHQLPFTGTVDCPRFLDIARERGMSLLVEVKTEKALRRAVGDLRARGYAAPSKSVK
jgi:sugar phosphate isomerase/epimerase